MRITKKLLLISSSASLFSSLLIALLNVIMIHQKIKAMMIRK
nr:hypothetical protein [Mycoplasmopsis bovis]